MEQKPSYIIFARYPELLKAKTRLVPILGAEGTLQLYTAMVLDIVENVLRRNTRVEVCVFPPERVGDFQTFLSRNGIHSPFLSVSAQQGETLGDKMYNAFCQAQQRDALPAIMLGSDSPTLPEEYLQQAEEAIIADGNAVVLGPSEDGGFYLMGLTQPKACYFLGENYSNAEVFYRTWEAVEQNGALPIDLPSWYDIDDGGSLEYLCGEILNNPLSCAYRTRVAIHFLLRLL